MKKIFAGKRRYIISLAVTLVLVGTLIALIYIVPLERKYWLGVILLLLAWFTFGRGYPSFVKIEGDVIFQKDFILAKYRATERNEIQNILLDYDGKVTVYFIMNSQMRVRLGNGYHLVEELCAVLPHKLFQVKWSGASFYAAPLKHRKFLLENGLITKEQFDCMINS